MEKSYPQILWVTLWVTLFILCNIMIINVKFEWHKFCYTGFFVKGCEELEKWYFSQRFSCGCAFVRLILRIKLLLVSGKLTVRPYSALSGALCRLW